jgi:hypothetical protein
MKHLWLSVATVVLMAPGSAIAQEMWVRGTVSAITSDAITVKAMDQDMKIAVTPKTAVVARGAETAAQAAEERGKTGVNLTDFVKAGERVEVHYTEAGGVMTATWIRVGILAADAKSASERGRVVTNGTVVSVDGTSLTITAGAKEIKFALDSSTRFVGSGLGTKTEAAGGKLKPMDLVGKGDVVSVLYQDRAGSMLATEVRVRRRAGPSK